MSSVVNENLHNWNRYKQHFWPAQSDNQIVWCKRNDTLCQYEILEHLLRSCWYQFRLRGSFILEVHSYQHFNQISNSFLVISRLISMILASAFSFGIWNNLAFFSKSSCFMYCIVRVLPVSHTVTPISTETSNFKPVTASQNLENQTKFCKNSNFTFYHFVFSTYCNCMVETIDRIYRNFIS